jgi:hypothetical protein
MQLVVKLNPYSISHTFYLYFYALTFIKAQQINLLLNKVTFDFEKLNNNIPQSLSFDTLNIVISYDDSYYCKWLFLLLIFLDTKRPLQFLAPLPGTANSCVIKF